MVEQFELVFSQSTCFQSKEEKERYNRMKIYDLTWRLASSIALFFSNIVKLVTFRITVTRLDIPNNSTIIPYENQQYPGLL
jgi:hypothetical protein